MRKLVRYTLFCLILVLTFTVFTACNSSSHIHKWGSWYDSGDGTHMRMCLTDSDHTEYAPHVFSDYEIIKEPTDILSGRKERKCTLCGYTETEIMPFTGDHIFDKEIKSDEYLFKRTSAYSSVYYKSCECGAYGNPEYLFEETLLPGGYSGFDYICTDSDCVIDTGIEYDSSVKVNYNASRINEAVPEEYIQAEYIETDGEAYIDTGFNETDETTIDCDFYIGKAINNYLFGGTQKAGFMYNGFWNNYLFEYNFQGINFTPSERLYMTQCLIGDTLTYNINGVTGHAEKGKSLRTRMYLFACNGGTRPYKEKVKCYMFRIFDNGKIVRDFVPCVRKSDSEAGMYDVVNGKFYTNVGEGNLSIGGLLCGEEKFVWDEPSFDNEYPDSYEVLEYIEGDGSQEINTGILMNPDTDSFEIMFKSNDINQNGMILASKEDDNYIWFYHYSEIGEFALYSMSGHEQLNIETAKTDTAIHTARFKDRSLYIDGIKYGTLNKKTGLTSQPVYLFSCGNDYFYKGRIYRCRMYKEGLLVRDLVPSLRKSDGETGMYDLVGKEFYPNQGSGSFRAAEKLPDLDEEFYNEYYLVDYIEATGRQWIDTQVTGPAKWVYDIQYTDIAERQLMGHGGKAGEYWGITNGLYGKAEWSTSEIPAGGRDIFQVNNFNGAQKAGTGGDVYINGVYAYNNAYDPLSEENSAQMFAIGGKHINCCKLFRCRVYDVNNELLRDFIPCVNKTSGKAGLYDAVNRKFYKSQGTDDFVCVTVIRTDSLIIGYNYDPHTITCMPMRIYDAEIESAGTLLKLIPAIRHEDGRTGMYDVLNGVFYPFEEGCEIVSSNIVTHVFGEEKTVKEATYCEDGLGANICEICGEEITHIIPRTAYRVDIEHDDGIDEVRVLNSLDSYDYSVSDTAYSRNAFSHNYSRINACVMLSFKLKDGYSVDKISFESGNAVVQETENDIFLLAVITSDIKLNVRSKKYS